MDCISCFETSIIKPVVREIHQDLSYNYVQNKVVIYLRKTNEIITFKLKNKPTNTRYKDFLVEFTRMYTAWLNADR